MTSQKDWISEELEAVLYDAEVEQAIDEIFPSNDPLDKIEFDPVEYINELFPTEQSLAGVDDTITRMRVKIQTLDSDIRGIVREQADTGHDGRQSLEEAQRAIEELFGRIRVIKGKAEHSELMVKKITGDIKQLDIAKKNLTESIRTLERLRLLVTNLEDIDQNMRLRQYTHISNQLKGAEDVVEEFKKYQAIPQIKDLIDRLALMKRDLASQIKVDFEKAFSIRGTAGGAIGELHEGCLVVDALGKTVKEDLIRWFIKMQLSDYDMLFHESLEPAWLDKVDRRYSWLKRTLLKYEDECSKIFPQEWALPERICVEFCHMTKTGLSNLMKSRKVDLEVKLLLFAIQKTTTFEKFLASRFVTSEYMESLMPPKQETTKQEERESEGEEESMTSSRSRLQQDSSPFLGMISRCFEPHLNVYIESQDRNLAELIEQFVADMKGFDPRTTDGGCVAFPSAADLFIFYKKCLVQCSSLSTGPPLLELTSIFQKYLKDYADKLLLNYIPKISSASSGTSKLTFTGLRRDTPSDLRLTNDELIMTCTILCTADYCLETTQQLESKLKEKIESHLSDKIDFTPAMDYFRTITSNCIQLLVQDSESACVAAFNVMVKLPWGSIEAVGDQSSYVSQVVNHIKTTVPLIRESLFSARKYFINFCHKFANAFVPSFITHVYKCKPISTIAAEQLLLDTHSLKTCLLELPSIGSNVSRKPPASYTKLVSNGMEKAELIIKIVMSPHDQGEEFVSHYLTIMQGDKEITNFQKILEMKGLRRAEQSALVDLFKVKAATAVGPKEGGESVFNAAGGGLLSMKKLDLHVVERLMRPRADTKTNK